MLQRTFRIFLIFFCSGEGKKESESPGRGERFFTENPRRLAGLPGRVGEGC